MSIFCSHVEQGINATGQESGAHFKFMSAASVVVGTDEFPSATVIRTALNSTRAFPHY